MNNIVVPTYKGHFTCMEKFLETFQMNCIDYDNVIINLIISDNENDMFTELVKKYDKLHIKIHLMHELLIKYDTSDITSAIENDTMLLEKVGKFTFQSMKKLFGILESNCEYACLFDSECLFIRKFRIDEYIDGNKDKIYYCSKMIKNNAKKDRASDMQCYTNAILDIIDHNWYLELYLWILNKNILRDIYKYLLNKYQSFLCITNELFIEYAYYEYYKKHQIELNNKYNLTSEWIDSYQLLKDNMSRECFDRWSNGTYSWCMFEHIGQHLNNIDYKQMDELNMIYDMTNLPVFRVVPNRNANQMFLLMCPKIKICVSEFCSDVYDMTKNDLFNKKMCLCISGLYRNIENINELNNFVYPQSIDTYYYVSSENRDIHSILDKCINTNEVIVNNSRHDTDLGHIKMIPPCKPNFVQNTVEMFSKKLNFIKLLNKYDILINMRPDLSSLDKDTHLIDIIYDIIKRYDENVVFTTKLYDSVGIADTFAAGSSKVMGYYFNIYNNLLSLAAKYVFNPESLVYHQFDDNGIKNIPIDWNYRISWHDKNLINAQWRVETSTLLNYNFYDDFVKLKTNSFETISYEFYQNRQKHCNCLYQITHYKSGKHLHVSDPNKVDGLCIDLINNDFSKFDIIASQDTMSRANIKLNTTCPNQNKNSSGWHIYTTPTSCNVYGRGDNGKWAQFYIERVNCSDVQIALYYIVSFHSLSFINRDKTFGRYMGSRDGKLSCDLPQCDDALWCIKII